MKPATTSVQRRLVGFAMVTCSAVLLATAVALVWFDAWSYRRALAETLTTRAAILASNSAAAIAFDNPDDAAHVLSAVATDPHARAAALYSMGGRMIASYRSNDSTETVPTTPPELGNHFDATSLVVAAPVEVDGRSLGTIMVRSDLEPLRERQLLYGLVVLLAMLGSLAGAFVLSSYLQRGITHPIRVLGEAAQRVSKEKDFSIRAPVVSHDELGALTEIFNDMVQEIQGRDREIRQLNTDLERRVAQRTRELEATNRELEAFSYSISHDLRAPVRHIAGFADLLCRKGASQLDDTGRRYLDNIAQSAQRMGQLIDDLLAFSRMGRTELQATRLSLGTLVGDVVRELEPELQGRAVTWSIPSLPDVHADPAMLRQVFANLISNAIKYTAPRAEAAISLRAEESPAETIIAVSDNGVGFDMNYSPKLFGVFQRLHAAEEFEGTGIGLANVRRIVQRHGGRTWAEGEVGRGATFYFSLPKLKEAA